MRLTNNGPNCHSLEVGGNSILFSYGVPVAAVIRGQAYQTEERYSSTTEKHIIAYFAFQPERDIQSMPGSWFHESVLFFLSK